MKCQGKEIEVEETDKGTCSGDNREIRKVSVRMM